MSTAQYRIAHELASELSNAIKDDLPYISGSLLGRGVITEENHAEFTDTSTPTSLRASNVVKTLLNRIETDLRHYTAFVEVLEGKRWYYDAILQKFDQHNERTECKPPSDRHSGSMDQLENLTRFLTSAAKYVKSVEEYRCRNERISRREERKWCVISAVMWILLVLSLLFGILRVYLIGCYIHIIIYLFTLVPSAILIAYQSVIYDCFGTKLGLFMFFLALLTLNVFCLLLSAFAYVHLCD